ncbi:MAG: hypothetical protein DRI57_29285 [Deltaproteobacteria bacterium]|nr:MAG: hypothetical protein DRI57_29285 [Deltaproteobacteria bacterium]
MANEQELISKVISDGELSEMIKVIKNNKISKWNEVVYDHKEWHSSDGNSFQTLKTADDTAYLFEINSDCEISVLGRLYDLMADLDLVIELDDGCEHAFRKLSEKERDEIIKKAEYYGELFVTDRTAFLKDAHQPVRFRLDDKFDSSLYCFGINQGTRIIASVDDDPIFKSVTVTLLSVFRNGDTEEKFKSVARSFYRRQFADVKQI